MADRKKRARHRKYLEKIFPSLWLERHFREIGFVTDERKPKDRVVAGLGLKEQP